MSPQYIIKLYQYDFSYIPFFYLYQQVLIPGFMPHRVDGSLAAHEIAYYRHRVRRVYTVLNGFAMEFADVTNFCFYPVCWICIFKLCK